MELDAEFIDGLRQAATIVEGDVDHSKFIETPVLRSDILKCIPDTIITTVDLSVAVTDLMDNIWHLVGTRLVNGINCAEFMVLAPFALRIAVLGTNFCPVGEYIMFRESEEDPNPGPVLVRQGIQG